MILEGQVVIVGRGQWHQYLAELEHRVGLGLVDDEEHDRAIERLDGPDPTSVHRYRAVADEAAVLDG